MLSSQEPSPFAALLAARLAHIMTLPQFHTHVWSKLSAEERWRLYALRQQALVGDAPASSSHARTASSDSSSSLVKMDTTTSTSHVAWYDVNGRMCRQAWVALRGTMTALVATETFCAEVLAVMDAHPCPTLLPVIESAVRQAVLLSSAGDSVSSSPSATLSSSKLRDTLSAVRHAHIPIDCPTAYQRESPSSGEDNIASAQPAETTRSAETAGVVFVVRALQGDPAAVMLLWISRAYGIPHEFLFEPIASLMPSATTATTTKTASNSSQRHSETAAADAVNRVEEAGMPVVFAEARDVFPFEASLVKRTPQELAATKGSTGKEALSTAMVVVTDPVSATSLLVDFFLSSMPNWRGVASTVSPVGKTSARSGEAKEWRLQAVQQNAAWLEDMQAITRHLRGPVMALQVDAAARDWYAARQDASSFTTESSDVVKPEDPEVPAATNADSGAVRGHCARVAGREILMREAALHLAQYEQLFVQRRLREAVAGHSSASKAAAPRPTGTSATSSEAPAAGAPTTRSPHWFLTLTESGAAQRLVEDYFASTTAVRLVSAVDLYAATCAYVLCTNPLCQDMLPLRPPNAYHMPDTTAATTAQAAAAVTRDGSAESVFLPSKRKVDITRATSAWSSAGSFRSFPRVGKLDMVASSCGEGNQKSVQTSRGEPLIRLPGVSASVNRLTNAVLQGEAIRTPLVSASAATATATSPSATASTAGQRRLDVDCTTAVEALGRLRTGLYPATHRASLAEASLAMLKMESQVSDALGHLIRARLTLDKGDLPVDEAADAPTVFPALVSILAGAWALSQAQLAGFPFLWLNPRYGYLLADLVVSERESTSRTVASPKSRAMRRNAGGFYVRKAPESPSSAMGAASVTTSLRRGAHDGMVLGSWQSKLQQWWSRAAQRLTAASRGAGTDNEKTAPTLDERTQVLKRDGSEVAAAKL